MELNTKMLNAALSGKHSFAKGKHRDVKSGNLNLLVSDTGAMSWVFIYKLGGKRHHIGLGSFTGKGSSFSVTLEQARAKADILRGQIAQGLNPAIVKKAEAVAAGATFRVFMERYIKSQAVDWKGDKQEAKWRSSLAYHAGDLIDMPVNAITTDHVVKVLEPIWPSKTGEDIRHRLMKVLSNAKDHRQGMQNAAVWEDNLEHRLSRKAKKSFGDGVSHAAMSVANVPAFLVRLAANTGMAAKALTLVVLTAVRASEASQARWSEFDLDAALWTIPAERMKAGRVHQVPLSTQAVALLRGIARRKDCPFVFTSNGKSALADSALRDKLRSMKLEEEATTHGFRATFSSFFDAHYPGLDELREISLAHSLGVLKGAYSRDARTPLRAPIMQAWADYCETGVLPVSNVVPLRVAA